jgi:hypothetical protein
MKWCRYRAGARVSYGLVDDDACRGDSPIVYAVAVRAFRRDVEVFGVGRHCRESVIKGVAGAAW